MLFQVDMSLSFAIYDIYLSYDVNNSDIDHSSFSFDTFMKTSSRVLCETAQAFIEFFISYSSSPIDYLLSSFLTKFKRSL